MTVDKYIKRAELVKLQRIRATSILAKLEKNEDLYRVGRNKFNKLLKLVLRRHQSKETTHYVDIETGRIYEIPKPEPLPVGSG